LGNLYIAGRYKHPGKGPGVVLRVGTDGIAHRLAGGLDAAESPDGTPATTAAIPVVDGITVDSSGKIYLAMRSEIRALVPDGDAGCTLTTSTTSVDAPAAGGNFSIDVNAPAYLCPYGIQASADWIKSSSGGGEGNGPVTLAIDANNGAERQAMVTIGAVTITVKQAGAGVASSVTINAVKNAASELAGPVAPGEMVVIYGSGLGPATLTGLTLDASGLVSTKLAGTAVLFDGIAAPLVYTSASVVAAVVPYRVTNAQPQVTVEYQGQQSAAFPTTLAASAPAFFTADASGKGPAAAVNGDGSYNGPGHGAKAGSMVVLFATGEGQTSPAGLDGKPAAAPLPKPVLPVSVTIGGKPAEVLYAGGAPGEVAGVMQVNVRVPAGLAAGQASVVIQVGTASSRGDVTLTVQ
jgi:uncharacterized protein (TIGR03437 family)